VNVGGRPYWHWVAERLLTAFGAGDPDGER